MDNPVAQASPGFPVFDGHVDLVYTLEKTHGGVSFEALSEGPVTLEKLRGGNVRALASALYCPDTHNGPHTAPRYLHSLLEIVDRCLTRLMPIRTPNELDTCFSKEQGDTGMLPLLENADALVDLGPGILAEKGIFVVGLTHAGKNRIGDGNGVSTPNGLTAEGRKLVSGLRAEGIAIDAAHLAAPGFWNLVRIFDGPLLSSHTGFRFFCDTPRNLDREQLRVIVERNGVVGITVNPEMLNPSGTAGIPDVFRHIDWLAQHLGTVECIALGSDFCGFGHPAEGLEDICKLQTLATVLKQYGYPDDAVTGILGGNWHRFYRNLLKR